jgi:DNA-binding response OmpR family regulator
VWGGAMRHDDRSVDVYIHKVRSKLADALPEWRFIHTHFGFGYRFSPEPRFTPFSHGEHSPVTGSAPLP